MCYKCNILNKFSITVMMTFRIFTVVVGFHTVDEHIWYQIQIMFIILKRKRNIYYFIGIILYKGL